MITGEVNPKTVSYRQKEGLNFSSIKLFEDKGVGAFYNEYILGNKKHLDSQAIVIGSMVDDIVLNYAGDMNLFYQHFDEKYVKFDGNKSSAQAFVLADYLYDSMMETAVNGVVTADFENCFREAFDKVQAEGKYKGKTWEKALEDFEKVARDYFDKKIDSIGKQVVDLKTLSIAEEVSKNLLTDSFTASLLKGENAMMLTKVEVDFEYQGVKCKAELDGVFIDHENQTVQGFDLKCVYDNEEFSYAYVKNKYYLQQAFYQKALIHWCVTEGFESFALLPYMFIVADTSINKRRPLIYTTTAEDGEYGVEGFELNGRKYRGIKELVKEIKWHMENDIWNCSKEAIERNGNLGLNINYDK